MRFEAGQVWSYASRPGEEGSTVTILAVERGVVHVYVRGIRLASASGEILRQVYLPLAPKALEQSVRELLHRAEQNPGFPGLQDAWLDGMDTRGQGVFTAPLARVLDTLERMRSGSD